MSHWGLSGSDLKWSSIDDHTRNPVNWVVAICYSEMADRCRTCRANASCCFADGLDEGMEARLGEILLESIFSLRLLLEGCPVSTSGGARRIAD